MARDYSKYVPESRSKSIFFPGTLNRIEFLGRTLVVIVAVMLLIALHNMLFGLIVGSVEENPDKKAIDGMIFLSWLGIVIFYHTFAFVGARFKDMGLPRLWAISSLVPGLGVIVELVCLFVPTGALSKRITDR